MASWASHHGIPWANRRKPPSRRARLTAESTMKYAVRNSRFAATAFDKRHNKGIDPKNASSAVQEMTNRYACPFAVKAHGETRTTGNPIQDEIFKSASQVKLRQPTQSN